MTVPSSALDVNGQVVIDQKNFGGQAGLLVKGLCPNGNWPTIGLFLVNTSGIDVQSAAIYGEITGNSSWAEAMNLLFMTAGAGTMSEKVRITGSGNVGIGTSSPAHLLHVAGTIGAQEVIVSSNGADYVFDDGYRLAPLDEVAEYVKENHHLPDIPSAKEVQEKGLSLGDMQAKPLAKILTERQFCLRRQAP